jgi:hypothetical protein
MSATNIEGKPNVPFVNVKLVEGVFTTLSKYLTSQQDRSTT